MWWLYSSLEPTSGISCASTVDVQLPILVTAFKMIRVSSESVGKSLLGKDSSTLNGEFRDKALSSDSYSLLTQSVGTQHPCDDCFPYVNFCASPRLTETGSVVSKIPCEYCELYRLRGTGQRNRCAETWRQDTWSSLQAL